ncbi:MAG: hypothetical protein AAF587_37625 [Bacteroidota bacterium]
MKNRFLSIDEHLQSFSSRLKENQESNKFKGAKALIKSKKEGCTQMSEVAVSEDAFVLDILAYFFKERLSPSQLNDELRDIAARMLWTAVQASRRMDAIPRPPKGIPSPKWLVTEAVQIAFRMANNNCIYAAVKNTVALKWKSAYEIAKQTGQVSAQSMRLGGSSESRPYGFSLSSEPSFAISTPENVAWAQSAKTSMYVFYGFSGDISTPSFPNGQDKNQSFKLTAQTLGKTLQHLHPTSDVKVVQAWTKDIIIRELEAADKPIKQVHIVAHGDSGWISLAYGFGRGNRINGRISRINALSVSENEKALQTLKDEDALVAGFLTRGLSASKKTKIKGNHASNAFWQIWGCFSGWATTKFNGDPDDAEWDKYFKRLNFGQARLDGIAVEIAKTFGVKCTAARGKGGLEFWHGTSGKQVLRNTRSTAAVLPFWVWLTRQSKWHTYDSGGTELPKAFVIGEEKDAAVLTKPKPPSWLTDIYYQQLVVP